MTAPNPYAAPEFPGFENVLESAGEAVPRDDNPAEAALNRRSFLALSALGLATVAGCRRPDLEIIPYSAIPDDQLGHLAPGKPTFYATTIPRPGGSLPVLVESHDGRPTKIEGNPQHPASAGSTDAFAQAAVLDLYSPDRVMSPQYPGVMEKGTPRRWEDFDRLARTLAEKFAKNQGEGFAVQAEQVPSPSVNLIREHIKTALPKATWFSYEPVDTTEAIRGANAAFGQPLVPKYDFGNIDRILALDSDFLGCDPNAVEYSRAFASRRKVTKPTDAMNRLYAVESMYTVTGTMADHRLRLPASQIGVFVAAVAELVLIKLSLKRQQPIPSPGKLLDPGTTYHEKWVRAVADDLIDNMGRSAIIVGPRQPAWVHALAHAANDALGAYTPRREQRREGDLILDVEHDPFVLFRPAAIDRPISELAAEMRNGKVNTLLVIGGNPVFNAPADLGFTSALKNVPTKLRLGLFHDHTSAACDWHLPLAHFLESWGDTETPDGTLCCVQPLIAPLNGGKNANDGDTPPRGGRSVLEVLSLLTALPSPADGKPVTTYAAAQKAAYATVRKVLADRVKLDPNETPDAAFNRYKQLGFLPREKDKTAIAPPRLTLNTPEIVKAVAGYKPGPPPSRDSLEVTFHPDYSVLDGRFAMNTWLQELPDPITKLVWDNAALISPTTAAEFALKTGDRVVLTVSGAKLDVPVFVLPGQADFSIALPFGQFGEMRIAHVPNGGGTDVFPVRKSSGMHTVTGCKLEKTGRTADLVVTQEHGVIPEGRDILRDVPLSEIGKTRATGQGHGQGHGHEGESESHRQKIGLPIDGHLTEEDLKRGFQGGYGNKQQFPAPADEKQQRFPLDLARPELLDSQFQWGMVIDLSACTGCSACMVACQAENNIPVVGKTEVKRNRELHWIRLDRYFSSSDGHTADTEPTIATQPVACVHCEQAPCEQVCPVNAALHSPEGLNLQVYNRCIGTRYCANTCPYKVRRFNWFDFNKRQLDELRVPTPMARGGMSLEANLMPESLKMQKNPDVTVRMRGVMEKCTYCVQRLERGKIGAKLAAAKAAWGPERNTPSPYPKPKDPRVAGYDLDALGRVIVPDGLIVTACQAACPTKAITFGNVLDPKSEVAKLKKHADEYLLLGELNTKPRTSYLPRVRNPNPGLMS